MCVCKRERERERAREYYVLILFLRFYEYICVDLVNPNALLLSARYHAIEMIIIILLLLLLSLLLLLLLLLLSSWWILISLYFWYSHICCTVYVAHVFYWTIVCLFFLGRTENPPHTGPQTDSNGGLGAGFIAAIVIVVVAVFLAIVAVAIFLVRLHKRPDGDTELQHFKQADPETRP